ncbi:hypothetical protein [Pectobacterium parvum]|uniref:hypothetical protein n=1 Tax=Pectobacterium parvum TaxID=2778550 RepID=UPI000DC642DE|nr:hypothetical protein [Pectobacterium parvum]
MTQVSMYQLARQEGASVLPPNERGGLTAGSNNDRLFAVIREVHLQEAQEFRRKGYNSKVPEVDAELLTQLRGVLVAAKSQLCSEASVRRPLGSLWLLEQVEQITRLSDHLSADVIKHWVERELPGKNGGEAAETELGSRRTAQSLVERLESNLQTLICVVHTLRAIDDHNLPDKRHDMLVTELTDAFSSSDKSAVIQALVRMTAEPSGHTAWASLMQARAEEWEGSLSTTVDAMIETLRYEAKKANQKARELKGDSQTFFSHVAAYLQSLSRDLAKASINTCQNASSPAMSFMNTDKMVAPLSRADSLTQRIRSDLKKKQKQGEIVSALAKNMVYRWGGGIRRGHMTKEPSKKPEHVITDSIIRSILWQWQQPAIKLQHTSGALLSKVNELQKIAGMFVPVDYRESLQVSRNTSVSHAGENDMDTQVREWVSYSIAQGKPENQLIAKVETLERLLDGDIANARNLVKRLGIAEESIQNMLRRQRDVVLKMMVEHLPAVTLFLEAMDELLLDMARSLTASITALEKACQVAEYPTRDFAEAKKQAGYAQQLAIKVKESLSAESARLTERPLNEHSRSSRLAKHWASLVNEQCTGNDPLPDTELVFSSLKKEGLLVGTLSSGDPEGYLFATRLTSELENARNDELKLPMSPEQYTALEKGLVEYIVKWGQRRTVRGITRIIIELSFEQALDTVSFNVSSLFQLPYKTLKALIKIPYDVNKINNYTMPGHDKPYKAIDGLLKKKLKQLGFNLLIAPVPGVIKLATGVGVSTGAALYNLHVGNREKTFSAVYQRVTEGKHSEKIKMDSVGRMIFDSVADSTTMVAFKGARSTWQRGKSEKKIIPDNAFVSEYFDESKEKMYPQAQRNEIVAENKEEAVPVSPPSSLHQQEDVRPCSGNDVSTPLVRCRRAVMDKVAAQPHEEPNMAPANAILQSEFFNPEHGERYQDLTDNNKKQTYLYGIKFILLKIEADTSLSRNIRNNAYKARIGMNMVVPVDIDGYKLNNTFLLPDNPGSKSGILVSLDLEKPYHYISKGEDICGYIIFSMPDIAWKRRFSPQGGIPSGVTKLQLLRDGKVSFEDEFNSFSPRAMSITALSERLANIIEEDYSSTGKAIKNKLLMSRAIAGAHTPVSEVSATPVIYHVELTWDNMTPAEYLNSFAKPFCILSGNMQLISSSIKGETIQETEQHVHEAEYIGHWIDATAGVVTAFKQQGVVFSTAQSIAAIAADLAEGKDPDALAIAGVVLNCIPGGRIGAKIGKFSSITGNVTKYGLAMGNKVIDLATVGRSIKIAVDTGEPLAVYQALLASGMSIKNSYEMANNISSDLNISKTMEESAQLIQLEALNCNTGDYYMSSRMPVRTFRIGRTELNGRIEGGEIEISSDNGVNWRRGNQLHLLAYRLQNAGGVLGRPEAETSAPQNGQNDRDSVVAVNSESLEEKAFGENLKFDYIDSEMSSTERYLQRKIFSEFPHARRMKAFRDNPPNRCYDAMLESFTILGSQQEKPKVIAMLMYKNPLDEGAANHYATLFTKDGDSFVIDPTIRQFDPDLPDSATILPYLAWEKVMKDKAVTSGDGIIIIKTCDNPLQARRIAGGLDGVVGSFYQTAMINENDINILKYSNKFKNAIILELNSKEKQFRQSKNNSNDEKSLQNLQKDINTLKNLKAKFNLVSPSEVNISKKIGFRAMLVLSDYASHEREVPALTSVGDDKDILTSIYGRNYIKVANDNYVQVITDPTGNYARTAKLFHNKTEKKLILKFNTSRKRWEACSKEVIELNNLIQLSDSDFSSKVIYENTASSMINVEENDDALAGPSGQVIDNTNKYISEFVPVAKNNISHLMVKFSQTEKFNNFFRGNKYSVLKGFDSEYKEMENTYFPEVIPIIEKGCDFSESIVQKALNRLSESKNNPEVMKELQAYFSGALGTTDKKIISEAVSRISLIAENAQEIMNFSKGNNYNNIAISSSIRPLNPTTNSFSDTFKREELKTKTVAFVFPGDNGNTISINGDMISVGIRDYPDRSKYVGYTLLHETSHLATVTSDFKYFPTSRKNTDNAEMIKNSFVEAINKKNLDISELSKFITQVSKVNRQFGLGHDDEIYDALKTDTMLRSNLMLSNADSVAAYLIDIANERTFNTDSPRLLEPEITLAASGVEQQGKVKVGPPPVNISRKKYKRSAQNQEPALNFNLVFLTLLIDQAL